MVQMYLVPMTACRDRLFWNMLHPDGSLIRGVMNLSAGGSRKCHSFVAIVPTSFVRYTKAAVKKQLLALIENIQNWSL